MRAAKKPGAARGGVGFFEAGNFYPDVILWCLNDGGTQRIVFSDPHGREHEGPGSDKIALASEIKKLQKRLNVPDVTLESVILSPQAKRMRVKHLWTPRGQGTPDLAAMHVYFIGAPGYRDAVIGLATA